MRVTRGVIAALAAGTLVGGVALGVLAGNLVQSPKPGPVAAAGTPTPEPTALPSGEAPSDAPAGSPGSSVAPSATPAPTATPVPTPVLVPAPLTGIPVRPNVAARHVIAVMIDDQFAARPQSGLSDASVVWQAPAEGGIPRYLALFSEGNPPNVGPVRSSRLYFIAWAAEWKAVYVHAGGSPQALALLRSAKGKGSVVFDADAFRYEGTNLYRVPYRLAPHNLYTDAKNLRRLATKVKAEPMTDIEPHWKFAPDAPLEQRPTGGKITVPYPENVITYSYDRKSNTYLRSVSPGVKQVDNGVKPKVRIAPRNVVVMVVPFVPIGDKKHRLDGEVVGQGTAWISTNGKTIKGTWRKKSFSAPTRFFDKAGNQVTLTAGQTFINVVPRGTIVTIKRGTPPASPAPTPSPTPTPVP